MVGWTCKTATWVSTQDSLCKGRFVSLQRWVLIWELSPRQLSRNYNLMGDVAQRLKRWLGGRQCWMSCNGMLVDALWLLWLFWINCKEFSLVRTNVSMFNNEHFKALYSPGFHSLNWKMRRRTVMWESIVCWRRLELFIYLMSLS